MTVILPVLVLIGIGMFLRKRILVSDQGISDMKFVVLNICMPAALFRNFLTTTLTSRDGALLLIMTAAMAVTFLLGFVVCRIARIKEPSVPYLCSTIEGGCIGLVFYGLLFGQNNLYRFALLDAGGALFQWPVIMTLFAAMQSGKKNKDLAGSLKSMVNPVTIAIFSGVVLSACGLGAGITSVPAGEVLVSLLDYVSAPTGPIIIITIGYGIVLKGIPWNTLLKGILARMAIFAVVGTIVYFITAWLFPEDPLYRLGILLYYTAPPTFAYSALARREQDRIFVGTYLAVYTVLAVIAFLVITLICQ